MSGQKPAAAIYEGSISRSEVFYEKLPILIHYSRVPARDFCFGIILIKIYIREYPAVRVPSANVGFGSGQGKFLADSSSPFYDELAVHLFFASLGLLLVLPKRISPAPGGQYEGLSRPERFSGDAAWGRPCHALRLTLIAERPGGFGHTCRGSERRRSRCRLATSGNLFPLITPGPLRARIPIPYGLPVTTRWGLIGRRTSTATGSKGRAQVKLSTALVAVLTTIQIVCATIVTPDHKTAGPPICTSARGQLIITQPGKARNC